MADALRVSSAGRLRRLSHHGILRKHRGPQLADEFYAELRAFFNRAAESPQSYAIRERDLRRVNLERFPFHFLFRIVNEQVRILVVRHHKRRRLLGRDRR